MKRDGVTDAALPVSRVLSAQPNHLRSLERIPLPQSAPDLRGVLAGAAEQFARDWERSNAALQTRMKRVPSESRALIEMQLAAHSLHRRSEILGRAAESIHETVRKVQQAGGQ